MSEGAPVLGSIKDWSVSRKVISAFALILVATVALGVFSVERLSQVNDKAADIRTNWLPATRMLGEIKYLSMRYRQRQAIYLMTGEADRNKERAYLDTIKADFDQTFNPY